MLQELEIAVAHDIDKYESIFLFNYREDLEKNSCIYKVPVEVNYQIMAKITKEQIKDLIIYLINYLEIIESE